jgi:hypothetical protein
VTTTSTKGNRLENYVFPAEAARIVGITKQAMSKLIRQGYFTTKTVGGRILILRSEAASFVARPKGRPTKEMQVRPRPLAHSAEVIDRGNAERYISQAEAAGIRGVSKQAIADLIRRGRFTTVTIAGRRLVIRSEVEEFVAKPKLGRPPKKQTAKKATKRTKSNPKQ